MAYSLRAISSRSLHVNNPYSDTSESHEDCLSLQIPFGAIQAQSWLLNFSVCLGSSFRHGERKCFK